MTDTMDIYLESEGTRWEHARVRSLKGREAISELFFFDIDIVCDPGHELPDEATVAADLSLVFEIGGTPVRHVRGVVHSIRSGVEGPSRRTVHRLRLVPRLVNLALVFTQEVFVGMSIPDIVQDKLTNCGFQSADIAMRLGAQYPARDFVVEYKETDLAFVSRLSENLGVSFFFEQSAEADIVVFTDNNSGFLDLPGAAEVQHRTSGENTDVYALATEDTLATSVYFVRDYNFRTPLVDVAGQAPVAGGSSGGTVDVDAHVATPDEAAAMALIRSQEVSCRQRVYQGKSALPQLRVGGKTTIQSHLQSHAVIVTEVVHEATVASFDHAHDDDDDGDEAGGQISYRNSFVASPASAVFRPRRQTPKPRIYGFVTGHIQLGPSGEAGGVSTVDADGYYSVDLHFNDGNPEAPVASKPIRMMQPQAGPNYGMHFPLRRGTEVLVAFEDGDPDRPVILGAIHNAVAPSHVTSANAIRHQLKSPAGAVFEFGSKT